MHQKRAIGEREYNFLYANGSNQKQFRFQVDDVCKSLEKQKLNEKLKDVDYRDTFRDEPFLYHIKILNLLIQTCYISSNDHINNDNNNQQEDTLITMQSQYDSKNQNTSSPNKIRRNKTIKINDKDIILRDEVEFDGIGDDDDDDNDADDDNDNLDYDNEEQEQEGPKLSKSEKKQQKMNAYIDKLKDISKSDIHLQESKFNILVTRLKRVFKVFDLLQMLNLEDSFADWSKFSNEINQKQDETPQVKETEGKQGLFLDALTDKAEIERKKQIEESKKKFLSANQFQESEYIQQKNKFKEGMNLIKPHILNFMRKVHIQSETVISSMSEMITQQKEIALFFDKEGIRINCVKEGYFSEQYVEYIFDYLVPFMLDYFKKFVQKGPHNQHIQEDEERRDDKSLEIVIERILFKLPIFTPYLSQVQKDRITLVAKTIKSFETKVRFGSDQLALPKLNKNNSFQIKSLSPTREKKLEFKGVLFKNYGTPGELSQAGERRDESENNDDDKIKLIQTTTKQKFKSKLSTIQMTAHLVTEQQHISNKLSERNWLIFKEILQEEDTVQRQIQNEKIALAEAIVRVKKIVKTELSKDLVLKPDMFKLIKKFIKFLLYAPEDPENKDTIISLISVLKEVIESKGISQKKDEEVDEEKESEKKQKIQNMFDQLGAMKMILMVLSQNNPHLDNELIINYLSFASSLLEGGNNRIQNTIYNFFMGYQKSEVIFSRFNQIIRKQIRFIEQRSTSKNQADFIDMEEENQVLIQLLESVLRFLQLCVEGHYIDLQNYLRKQDNSRNNYDMVQAVADLLKAYYYGDRTQKMYDNMIFCLDTLSEFVQGPCKDNQEAVSDSKFFDIASDLFSKKHVSVETKMKRREKKKKDYKQPDWKDINLIEQYRKQKDEPLTEWMIGRLQNKVLILVLSLLESREVKSNCDIIKRIMRNLPLYVLQRHLIRIFKRFHHIYQSKLNRSSLSHMDQDPRRETDLHFFKKLHLSGTDIDTYLECILQNGFQIYFLLSYYIGGEMVKIFKNYERKIMNNEKSDLEDLLTGDNLIGQLISFARSLIESVYNYIDAVKQKTVEAVKSQMKVTGGEQKKDPLKQAARIKLLKKAMNFFASNSAHIDIVRNEMLELVYFIRLPATNCLPKEVKTEFHSKCDRSNIKTKQSELINESDDIIEICKHEYKLQILFSSNKFLALFANYVKLWKDLSFFISLVLNLFIIFSFQTKRNVDWNYRIMDYNLFDNPQYTLDETKRIFRILGIIMIVCSNFVLLFFLFKNVPLIIQRVMNNGKQVQDSKSCLGKTYLLMIKFIEILITFLQDVQVLYYIAYGALAVLGTVLHPFFFTFHLTAILMRYPTLKNVVMSIYLPRKQLLLTLLLFVILQYIFSVWGYSLYQDDYDGRCESLLYCFLTTFDQTFKPNGGVGGFLAGNPLQMAVSSNTAKYSISRFFYDQIFQYVMLNIMINIVVGIIIDTFGILREESNEQNQDMHNYCFVCGIEKTTFDRKSDSGKGFIKHIKFNHYMWNYVHFISYLEWKERNEYTGIESYVDDLLKQSDTSWMPFKQAREIGEDDSDDEDIDINQLSHIEKKQKNLVKDLNSLIDSVGDLAKEKKEKKK